MKLLTTLCLLLVYTTAGHAAEFTGRVVNADGEPLPGVSLTTRLSTVGTLTDTDGLFILTCPDSGVSWVTFSSVGYQSRQFDLAKLPPTIVLDPRYYREGDIIVTGDRAQAGLTPIAFDNVSEDDIARDYTVGEFPLLLEGTPNLYAYSDAGTPLGYSYIRIRGFDDKRIATYINGVPLNDPEDQSTYFTDLPDFAANITDIQVQRGVGNSLYGDASFGGSINIVTSNLSLDRNVTLSSGYGVYTSDGDVVSDIYKQSIEYASGLIDGRWLFSGRFSKQKTGGYRYNSWYEGWSYYFSMARLDPNMTTELYIYGGPIRMHLSYWGEYREVIEADRRANPLTYDNETDNFNQPHYHLHNTYKLSDRMTLSNTLYYIRGKGYYEQLKSLEEYDDFREYGLDTALVAVDTAGLVRQQWVHKNQVGWNPRLDIEHDRGRHSFGGSFYYFSSDHWGQAVWVEGGTDPNYDPRQRYYQYDGTKYVGSMFAEEYFDLTDKISTQLTAQLRYQRYKFDQTRMGAFLGHQYDVDWFFFSPRIGLTFQQTDNLSWFANFAISSRTPTDASIYDANDPYVLPSLEIEEVNADSTAYVFGDPTAESERVYNFEVGGQFRAKNWALGLNGFWMEFRDEILPYGGVDDDGLRITVNADRSVHAGIEATASVVPSDGLTVSGNYSFNYNRIRDYVADIDGFAIDFADKKVTGFPDHLGHLLIDYRRDGLRATMRNQFVGRQYMDLWNVEELSIDPYYSASVSLSYSFERILDLGRLTLAARVNNLFDNEYLNSGYGGNYAYEGLSGVVVGGWAQYFVAAERSFFTELKLELF